LIDETPMLTPELETPLALVEYYFDAVSDAILPGDAQALQMASAKLKQASVDFSGVLRGGHFPNDTASQEFKARIINMTEGFAMQRENLMRRNASVERALNVIIPASCGNTYQPSAGQYGSGGVRPSGEFRFVTA
jgi:hypothetical protein